MAGLNPFAEQWHLPLAILAMVLGTLFMAGLVHRYQQSLAERQAMARRLALGARRIDAAMRRLHDVPLPTGVGRLLRRDVLERYQRIVRLDRRFPALNRHLLESGAQLKAEPTGGGVAPTLDDATRLANAVGAVDELIAVVERGGLLQSLPTDDRRAFGRALRERRAELMAAHYLAAARTIGADNPRQGRTKLNELQNLLRSHGPETQLVRDLYYRAEALKAELSMPADTAQVG